MSKGTTAAASSSGSSAPLVSIIAGIWAYVSVPTFSAAGFAGVLAAGAVGIATGVATGFFGGIGALAGLMVVGGGAALTAAAVRKDPKVAGVIGGLAGAVIGGLTAGYTAMVYTFDFAKEIAVDVVQDHQAKKQPQVSAFKADKGDLSVVANKSFGDVQAASTKTEPSVKAGPSLKL